MPSEERLVASPPLQEWERPVGLALGSGSARGWAHIGVIRALEAVGVTPTVVCGSSIGAVVGAAYASGDLDPFEAWVRQLDWRRVAAFFDFSARGGLLKARKVIETLAADLSKTTIESLDRPFAAVATDLETGREVWLRAGPLAERLRASVALPGLITPVLIDGRWLVDGGLVNPVPVSLCRALGAQTVVAVDLNTTLLGRRFGATTLPPPAPAEPLRPPPAARAGQLATGLQDFAGEIYERVFGKPSDSAEAPPSIYEAMANSIHIMQLRITRSRMAGDPPDLLVTPRLQDFGMFDFGRAAEAIEEGRRATVAALAAAARPQGP